MSGQADAVAVSPDPLAVQVRAALHDSGAQAHPELCALLPHATSGEVRTALSWLRESGHVTSRKAGPGKVAAYELTTAGRMVVLATREPMNVATTREHFGAGIYDGAELRRLVTRAGAYDAFGKPSRMGDVLSWPAQTLVQQ